MSYRRKLSMMASSRHIPESACVVKSTTLRHWGRHLKTSNLQQHIKLLLESSFDEVFTFIALQTKT